MAVFKCKMCGGDLNIVENVTVVECDYCGTKQTVAKADDEKKMSLFARANRLRLANEFDKAAGVYETIVSDFPEEAEGYWGLVLCAYGIEYVDDPKTGAKIPTCHRSSFDSVMDNSDFEQVMENADSVSRGVYRAEAKAIEEIRKGIIEVSGKEEPYDIFICYKETDENGERTIDSVIAQDVYDALTEKGYRVFFSRISLEDKLGTEYEPYIFGALNSAKIMLAFGTDYEYYNAVWVKNEWSRFLKLIERGEKKTLIPCYKNIDAYDMPKEFARLQAQDMGKVGAMQDLMRGIEKILPKAKEVVKETVKETVVVNTTQSSTEPLLKRMFMFLEDGNFKSADEYAEKVLDIDPENGQAYLGKLLSKFRLKKTSLISTYNRIWDIKDDQNYEKLLRFGTEKLCNEVKKYVAEAEEKRRKAIEKTAEENRKNADRFRSIREKVAGVCAISVGNFHVVGLKSDGTVLSTKGDVSEWTDIVAISAGGLYTVGLKSYGTVVATKYGGSKEFYCGECEVSDWRDIVAISTGEQHTVGLKSDGTVVAVGKNNYGQCNVSDWRDIVAISAGDHQTVGLKSDGTVVATSGLKVSEWTDIVAISAGYNHIVGLKSNGEMVIKGRPDLMLWGEYVAVSSGNSHIVVLNGDGTVKAEGDNIKGQCNVSGWKDIVAISAFGGHTMGLKSDGTVVVTGLEWLGQCNVQDWKLFDNLEKAQEEKKAIIERGKEEKPKAERRAQGVCQYCGGSFKGVFTKACASCGAKKDY